MTGINGWAGCPNCNWARKTESQRAAGTGSFRGLLGEAMLRKLVQTWRRLANQGLAGVD